VKRASVIFATLKRKEGAMADRHLQFPGYLRVPAHMRERGDDGYRSVLTNNEYERRANLSYLLETARRLEHRAKEARQQYKAVKRYYDQNPVDTQEADQPAGPH
jgi:hypothetical protein